MKILLIDDDEALLTIFGTALKKDGFEPKHAVITRNAKLNVGALIGGIFFLIPLLWVMDYEHDVTYELDPVKDGAKTK